jgi:uncharacterized protein
MVHENPAGMDYLHPNPPAMKRLFPTAAISCLSLLLLTGIPAFSDYRADSAWVRQHYRKMERYIPMRDGARLFTSIYVPVSADKTHPILLTRTPYSCSPYGEDRFLAWWHSYRMAYLREGYILVIQDVRGRWMSEGEFVDVRPFNPDKKAGETDEASDTWDTVEWLLANLSNHNGRVGVYGISYPGFYATMAAASGHPAIAAVSPQAPVTNWFIGDDFHHNGAFFILDAFSFYVGRGFGRPRPQPTTREARNYEYPIRDNYKFFLEGGAAAHLGRPESDSIPFWQELLRHPDYDAWWQARDARRAMHGLKPAMLWVGGLFDAEDHWGAWNAYRAAEAGNPGAPFNKLIMGPWYHNQWETRDGTHLGHIHFGSNTVIRYQEEMEIPFFNFFLKDKGSANQLAEATIFFTGANEWREFGEWPPAAGRAVDFYLHAGGALSNRQPPLPDSFSEYISDPAKPVPYTGDVHFNRTRTYMVDDQRFASRRPDVLVFKTGVLEEDLTVAGEVIADLQVSLSSSDADFVVKVIDVFPDSLSYNEVNIYDEKDPVLPYPMGGYEMLVHGEVMRGRYRNSLEKPEPFVPGAIERVRFSVGNIAHTFRRGHRLMLQVQSSWFPLVDRNPQQFIDVYHADPEDYVKSTVRIYHQPDRPSRLIVPVLSDVRP